MIKKWLKRGAGIMAAVSLLTVAPVLPNVPAPIASRAEMESGDAIAALIGLLGTGAMYGSYLSAVMDAGNNSIYQEQTDIYDARENGISTNAIDQELADNIMNQLVERGDYVLDIRSLPFRWRVNACSEFNAACFPTNMVTVNSGLIRGLDRNVDEIAGVLAHEMTHGLKLHAAYTYARAAAQSFGIQFLSMVTGAADGRVASVLADYSVAKNIILPVEYEADEGGFYLAASAGFNPGGSAAAMSRMDYLSKHPETFDRSYGAEAYDHPDTDKREAKLSQMMTAYSCGHVTVENVNEVYIDGVKLVKAKYTSELYDNSKENAYLIAGGLAEAFHEYHSADGWNFRAGMNGRVDYLDDNRVYGPLKAAVAASNMDGVLERLVRAAYSHEGNSGARMKMITDTANRSLKWKERKTKNAEASQNLVERLYNNADWYNDVYRPELAIREAERIFGCQATVRQLSGLYAVRGRAHALMGEFEKAVEDCNHAVELDPKFAYAYLNRAEVWRAQGMPDEALADIRLAIGCDEKNMAAYHMAGDIEDELGDKEAAKKDYSSYLKLNKDARDLPDEYLKELAPKTWEEIQKEKAKAEKEKKEAEAEKKKKEEKEAAKKKDAKAEKKADASEKTKGNSSADKKADTAVQNK
ncbi:MAG: M48 family metalloprotease [Schwartzia sp.]|nr:M48 family metalloprotease [Schwartzia sp. (in: firmicutes)]